MTTTLSSQILVSLFLHFLLSLLSVIIKNTADFSNICVDKDSEEIKFIMRAKEYDTDIEQ
jgi:hypothetical protein